MGTPDSSLTLTLTLTLTWKVGTPDSSRIWDAAAYADGRVVENSKEGFRKMLQAPKLSL